MATLQRVICENFDADLKEAIRRETPSVFVRSNKDRSELVGLHLDGTKNEVILFRGELDKCVRFAQAYAADDINFIGVDE